MKVKVHANLSGAVTAVKGEIIVVGKDQGLELIKRRLASEHNPKKSIKAPAAQQDG